MNALSSNQDIRLPGKQGGVNMTPKQEIVLRYKLMVHGLELDELMQLLGLKVATLTTQMLPNIVHSSN